MQLMRSEGHPNSVFTRFSTGNLETLNKPNIRDALVDYHEKYYSSNLMSLVVLSPQNLNEMDLLTDHLFSQVMKRDLSTEYLQTSYIQTYPYLKGYNLGYFYKIEPVKEKDELTFYWIINENTNPLYDKKPLSYLSSLLGHEGENSLHSSLIKDDLITSLSAGYTTVANTFTKFYIHIDLTKKGLHTYESVTRRVMKYIETIKQMPINLNFFQEMKKIQQIKFDFKNKEDPTSYVSDLAYNFTIYNPDDILTGPYIISSYDENLIRKYMDSLVLQNLNIYLSSKSLDDLNSTEFWYGTKFSKEKFVDNLEGKYSFIIKDKFDKNLFKHKMDYPPVNKFLPTNFNLQFHSQNDLEKLEIYPEKIKESESSSVWYKQDNIFLLPKAAVLLQIYLNKSFLPVNAYDTICSVWNCLIDNELKNLTYMASEANLHFKFYFNLEGIYLQITGFNSSLRSATFEILNKLEHIISNPKGIEEINEKLKTQIDDHKKDYKNFYYSAPYTQAISYLEILLREPSTSPMKKWEYLNEFKEEPSNPNNHLINNCHYFIENFLKESKFEWLVQGNISKDETLQIVDSSEKILQNRLIKVEDLAQIRIAQIPEMTNYYYVLRAADKNNQNSAIVSFFQAGKLEDYEKCLMFLIESLLREKFFDELRTKQTLGYIVKFAHREMRKIDGFICLVQSSIAPPEDIQDRITKFLITNNLKTELTDETFEKHRVSVLTELKIKDLKLMEEVSRNFSEIKKRTYDFSRRQKLIELTEKAKKRGCAKYVRENFY
jgi:insulysin